MKTGIEYSVYNLRDIVWDNDSCRMKDLCSGKEFCMYYSDMLELVMGIDGIDRVVFFDWLFVSRDSRGKGKARDLLRETVAKFSEDVIFCTAGIVEEKMRACEIEGEYEDYLDRLVSFYEREGFIDIDYLLDWEFEIPMIYGNSVGKRVIKLCNR